MLLIGYSADILSTLDQSIVSQVVTSSYESIKNYSTLDWLSTKMSKECQPRCLWSANWVSIKSWSRVLINTQLWTRLYTWPVLFKHTSLSTVCSFAIIINFILSRTMKICYGTVKCTSLELFVILFWYWIWCINKICLVPKIWFLCHTKWWYHFYLSCVRILPRLRTYQPKIFEHPVHAPGHVRHPRSEGLSIIHVTDKPLHSCLGILNFIFTCQ